jgi:cytochrome c553
MEVAPFQLLLDKTAHYLANQLQHFASGSRRNAIMEPIAKKLTPEEIESVAQYYANADPPSIVRFPASPGLVARGKQLALIGDASASVQNCVSCHGPNGEGEPPTVPYLAGQYKHYIQVQLQMFNKGYRTSDQMARVAHKLPGQHVEDIAAYFDQLPRPSNQIYKGEPWNKAKPNFQTRSTTAHSKY